MSNTGTDDAPLRGSIKNIQTIRMERGALLPYRDPPPVDPPSQQDIWFRAAGLQKRRIFYNVGYTTEEQGWIEEIKRQLQRQDAQGDQDDGILLCQYYSANCQLKQSVEKILFRRKWFNNPDIQNLTDKAQELLRSGWVYHYQFSRQRRPFVVMQLGAVDLDRYTLDQYYQAINRVQNHVISKKFTPGKIQAYDYILDFQQKLLSLPLNVLGQIIHTISSTYSMKMRRMWVVNATFLVRVGYKTAKNFMVEETIRKIEVFGPSEVEEGALTEFIDPAVLQVKYGGTLPNLNYSALYRQQLLGQQAPTLIEDQPQTEYLSIEDNQEYFAKYNSEPCCGPQMCNIY